MPFLDQTALEAGPNTEDGASQPEIEELVIKRPSQTDTNPEQVAAVGGIFSAKPPLQSQGERGPVSLLLGGTENADDGEGSVEDEADLLHEQTKRTFVTELDMSSGRTGKQARFILDVEQNSGQGADSVSLPLCDITPSQSQHSSGTQPLVQELSSPLMSPAGLPMKPSSSSKPSSSKPLLVKEVTSEKPAVAGMTSGQFRPLIEDISDEPTALESAQSEKEYFDPVIQETGETYSSPPTVLHNLTQKGPLNEEPTKTEGVEGTRAPIKKDSFRPFIEVVDQSNSNPPCPASAKLLSQTTTGEENDALKSVSDEAPTAWAQMVDGRPLITEIGDDDRSGELQVEDIEDEGAKDLGTATVEGCASGSESNPSLADKGTEELAIQESKLMELAETVGSTLNRPPPDTKLYQELKKKWSKDL